MVPTVEYIIEVHVLDGNMILQYNIHNLNNFQDVVTDLNAEGEPLPIRPINEDWLGHKVIFSIM